MVFCPNCGKEIDDSDLFCKACGTKINPDSEEDSKEDKKEDKKEDSKEDKKEETTTTSSSDDKLLLIPLILGIIGVLVGLVEGLSCPMLFGFDNIITEMIVAIVGGCLGIYLYKFKKEYFVAGLEFIVTGIMMAFLIGNMAFIGAIIFIIAGITAIVLSKKYKADNNILYVIPVATVLLVFVVLLLMAGMSIASTNALSDQVSIDNVDNSIALSYGYYDGYVKGDLHTNATIDTFNMEMEFLDEKGKVLDTTYPLTENSLEAGKTYQFEAFYMKEEKPYKAQIILKNDFGDDVDPFYMQNITLA